MRPERLARPALESLEPSLWIDEAIWGHRLYDEQIPWLAFLEMLGVLRAEAAAGRAFQEPNGLNKLRYESRHLLYLRNIVFNNPRLATILLQVPDDAARWDQWRTAMRETTSGIKDPNYEYVSTRFNSFEDFALLVQLLRSTAIEGDTNKRWTSKFVFPYGPSCLYEDLRLEDGLRASNDRRFFARAGELVYLMLCRSGRSAELYSLLQPLLLAPDARWNRLVAVLEPPGSSERQREPSSSPYLPYANHDDFRDLAEDWLALLKTGLPGYDVLPHLVDILGLHLILYFLRRASEWSPRPVPVRLVVEIVAPKRSTVRDLASESFQQNSLLSKQAVTSFIDEELASSVDWHAACGSTDPFGRALEVAYQKVGWKALRRGGEDYD